MNSLPKSKSLNLRSPATAVHGFTLVEMLAAVAVLALIMGMLFQMMGMMSRTWVSGRAKVENSVRVRAMLDRVAGDIAAGISRPDLPAFRDNTGNSVLSLYVQRPGVVPQNTPNVRPLSLVSYRFNPDSNQLFRRDLPVYWTDTSGPFTNSDSTAASTALGNQPDREIASGIVAFSMVFLTTNQIRSIAYVPADPNHPYYDKSQNPNAPVYDAAKVSRAISISVAVLDSRTVDIMKPTGQLKKLVDAGFWVFNDQQNRSLLSDWQKAISRGDLTDTTNNLLPAALAANLQVLERTIPLPVTLQTL